MQKKVPMGAVFYRGEKLRLPGFRWAPKSFLRYDTDAKMTKFPFSNNTTGSGQAEPSENSLRFSCRGFDLRLKYTTSIRNGIPFRIGTGKWYKVEPVSDVTHWNPPITPSGVKAELMLISDQHDTEVKKRGHVTARLGAWHFGVQKRKAFEQCLQREFYRLCRTLRTHRR